jgi:MFS family permease
MALRGLDYKWVALSNTTLGMLMATINASILLIALPDIFRGIGIDPLAPGNTGYLLWLILGFMVVMAVLMVSLGRLGDIYGRVRMFNLGFAVFTLFSILLAVTWMHASAAAWWLISMRVGQGIGGAMLFANSSAILTDAFPQNQRGLALGVNSIAAIAGSFIGLVLGGVLAPVSWRLVFVVSVPIGLVATVWAYHSLREVGVRRAARIDWWGNVTFAVGLIGVMVGITYGIQPHGSSTMGWTSPLVLSTGLGGAALLVVFCAIELHVPEPMFRLELFKIRAFAGGNVAALLAAMGRGGLQFILIIWLQGIWLPRHGYDFAQTPLWAGIYMLPLIGGFLVAGPASGYLSDRFGARPFATGGLLLAALSFLLLIVLPVNFSYLWFALVLLLNGVGMGLFASPNSAGVMNSLPPHQRGAGAGMLATFMNTASVLSIGVFFTLMIVGLAADLPHTMQTGLVAHGVTAADAHRVSSLPPVAKLFASFLGYNPMATLLGSHALHALPAGQASTITGRSFFPQLISGPFHTALVYAFVFAIAACLVAVVASLLRGGKYHHSEQEEPASAPTTAPVAAPGGQKPVEPGGAHPRPVRA